MPTSLKQLGLRIINGQDQSLLAAIARTASAVIEPFYAAVMTIRNAGYQRGVMSSHDLGRPAISVGNITTGGTGKTPVVQWLAEALRRGGYRPAILLRGYGSASNQAGDEAQLLDLALNATGQPIIPVQANPSRVQGAANVLRDHPDVTHFILDDGFQHRRARRDFNLVLISATQPFGLGHVLPRGLLREPLSGLSRADAFLITRCSLVSTQALVDIDRMLSQRHPVIPLFHCDHHQPSVWMPLTNQTLPMEALKGRRVFLTAGIGDPAALERQIALLGCDIVGMKWWADHQAFTAHGIALLQLAAKQAQAEVLLTTAKDWIKIKTLAETGQRLPFAVINLEIKFIGQDEAMLMHQMMAKITV